MRSLAVDIGNTRTKAAEFDADELIEVISDEHGVVDQWIQNKITGGVSSMIISSVSGHVVPFGRNSLESLIILDHTTPLPIELRYDTPETLGRDRIAGVVGAHRLFPGRDVLVIDAGTCITYDVITAEGHFVGGNIAPGLNMRLRSMHEFTARLPLVNRPGHDGWLGASTEEAMQLGAQNGISLEIDGYIRRLEEEYANPAVIMTGGDGSYFAERLKTEIFVRPNLVLVGLNEILRYNVA